jgi:hypothetical protein
VLHIGPPKTRASRRTVGLPRFVVEELAAHLAVPADPEAFVFTAPRGGLLRVTGFRGRVWRPATRVAGLDGLRIHDLRHTAVALWIAAGANPKEVAARAGHASVSFTLDRYGHLYPEADTALRDRLDVLYGSARPTPEGTVVRLRGHAGRGPSVAPGGPGERQERRRGGSGRRPDLQILGVEVRGFEPLASSVRDLYRPSWKGLRGVEDRGRRMRNARSVAVDGRIGGHLPPRFSGGFPGRHEHRLLPLCCHGVPTPVFGPQSESAACRSRLLEPNGR